MTTGTGAPRSHALRENAVFDALRRLAAAASIISTMVASLLCSSRQSRAADDPQLPPPAQVRVDFDSQIKPLLQKHCIKCHARGKYKGGLSLETREAVLRGGEGGPAAVAGKSQESLLIELVAGVDPNRRMPEKGPALSPDEVGLLRAWIDQGVNWQQGFSFGFRRAPLEPRKPDVPDSAPGLQLDNPIDRFIAREARNKGQSLDWTPVSDRIFARRVFLDLTGLLPTPEQLKAFEDDKRLEKDARLVETLLSDRTAYADHWLSFWNDALRNAYRGTGFIDNGRTTITRWLYQSLYKNQPYDRFVHELISPVPGSEGFTKGIIWRGVVNASQAPPVQAAQNVSQVFLGTNLKCASCHDSFVNYWKLTDAYALASVFAEKPLELHRCDKPTGKTSATGFIYPQLGAINAGATRAERMKQLADILVKPENGRFSRTIVNRLWAHFMGHGIVEPLDDMDQPAWSQDVLDWLASDLVAHSYDLKHTLATICTSRAYRLPSVGVAEPGDREAYVFRGPLTKRMTAEQFADAVSTITGVWPQAAGDALKVDGRGQGGQVAAVRAAVAAAAKGETSAAPRIEAQWIWNDANAAQDPGGQILLRKVFQLDKVPERAVAIATCDNELVLYVNGQRVAASAEWTQPASAEITKALKKGDNVIAAEATNWPDLEHKRGTNVQGRNPAAFLAWVGGFEGGRQAWGIGTDASWLWIKSARGDWKKQPYDTAGWQHAVELPNAAQLYRVDLASALGSLGSGSALPGVAEVRAALVFDDPLLAAMGRTSREQVVTKRDSIATTLQALELSNGATLDERLKQGSDRWFGNEGKNPDQLVKRLFAGAFGRAPTPQEVAAAKELLGKPVTKDGVQDLLWAVTMLPEFQLID